MKSYITREGMTMTEVVELLAEDLALRDLGGVPLTRENYERLLERIDVYLDEFDAHGTDHVSVELEEP